MVCRRSDFSFNCALRILICLDLLFIGSLTIFAQRTSNQETHTYKIYKSLGKITVDGELKEDIWSSIDKFSDFRYSFPNDDRVVESEYQKKS